MELEPEVGGGEHGTRGKGQGETVVKGHGAMGNREGPEIKWKGQ